MPRALCTPRHVWHTLYILWNITRPFMTSSLQAISSKLPGLGGPTARSSVAELALARTQPGNGPRAAARLVAPSRQRTRIWDLHHSLHCSIVGTCLTTGELRRLLVRFNVEGASAADDQPGVLIAGEPKAANHLQKALDRTHRLAINQFAKADGEAALAALWDDAVKRGDIPGAYWAVLTHPAATDALAKRVFGEVHMLSHLVGAANRADIRRLRQLEQDNAALAAKLDRQQKQLRDGFTARDATIRRLTDALAQKTGDALAAGEMDATTTALTQAVAERERRLAHEALRRERLEQRCEKILAERDAAERARQLGERACATLRAEIESVEGQIGMLLADATTTAAEAGAHDLRGLCVLYVGGRARQAPQLKALVERINGRFLHHDGGLEDNPGLLPGLVSRADLAVFPVDCVSHDAATSLKRTCRQLGKRYLPLRTSSLTCLLAALAAMPVETVASAGVAMA